MTYWNSEDTVSAMLDYLAEAVPDVEIEYLFVDNSNYDTIVDTQLSAEEGPDIICKILELFTNFYIFIKRFRQRNIVLLKQLFIIEDSEKWSEMIIDGIYTTDMTGIDHDQALEQFAMGDAAMFCSGPWDLDAITAKNPDLQIDMMPFYGLSESAGWLIGGPGCGFAVNEHSANKEAAMKVVAAISTVEGQTALCVLFLIRCPPIFFPSIDTKSAPNRFFHLGHRKINYRTIWTTVLLLSDICTAFDFISDDSGAASGGCFESKAEVEESA
mgnify:CR=1 FL=1